MKEGDVYSAKAIKDDAKAMADAYGSGGYVDLTVIPESSPARGGLIDITYRIDEGQRSYVERINIIGNTRTKDKVIRREVLIAPGDVFNTVRVETSKKRLENLGYFSKVDTFPVDTPVEGRKNLDIQLTFGKEFSPTSMARSVIVWKISTLSILPLVPVRNLWPRRGPPPKVS